MESILSVNKHTLLFQGKVICKNVRSEGIKAEAPCWGCRRVVSLALEGDVLGMCMGEGVCVWWGIGGIFLNKKPPHCHLKEDK